MFSFLKRKECKCCGKKTYKGIEYAGLKICSEKCMVNMFKHLSIAELIQLERLDRMMSGNL